VDSGAYRPISGAGGNKSMVGNKGHRRHLINNGTHSEIDEEKVYEEERNDGTRVLCTNPMLAEAGVLLQIQIS
jgi:hypothetical protein